MADKGWQACMVGPLQVTSVTNGSQCPAFSVSAGPDTGTKPPIAVAVGAGQNAVSAVQNTAQAGSQAISGLGDIGSELQHAWSALTDPDLWKGIGLILAGSAVLLIGVVAWSGRGGEAAGAATRGAV